MHGTVLHLMLAVFCVTVNHSGATSCQIQQIPELMTTVTSSHSNIGEKYYLIGFFPAKLRGKYNRSGFVWIEVAKFAFQQLLEQYHEAGISINLDFLIFDSCEQINIASMQLLNQILHHNDAVNFPSCCNAKITNNIIGIIGPATSSMTDHLLTLLSTDLYPVISYSATSIRFNDKSKYPTFMRTISPDNLQAQFMLELVLYYNWTYVSVVGQDNEYGRMGMDELGKLFVENKVCTSMESVFNPTDVQYLLERLKTDSLSKVVIVWASGAATSIFLRAAIKAELFHKVFIFTESLNENKDVIHYDTRIMQGVFSIVPDAGVYHKFEHNFKKQTYTTKNQWLKYFFENYTNKNGSLNQTNIGDHWKKLPMTKNGHIYNAINAYGEAMKKYILTHPNCANTSTCFKDIVQDRRNFFDKYMRNVVFEDLHGNPTTFDSQGNQNSTRFFLSTPQFINGRLQWKRVGDWNKNRGLHIHETFYWPNNETAVLKSRCGDECPPGYAHHDGSKECCWQCVPCGSNTVKPNRGKGLCTKCPTMEYANKEHTKCRKLKQIRMEYGDTASVILITIALSNTFILIFFGIIFIIYRRTPVVVSSQKTMSTIQMVFLGVLNFNALFSFQDIDNRKCFYYGSITPFVLTLAIAPTILKTQRLVTIFKAKTVLNQRRSVLSKDILKILVLILIQGAIIVISYAFDSYAEMETIIDIENMEINVGCRYKLLLYLEICYLFILFSICGIASFKARELPTNYNETRVIAYAMFMCSVSLFFIFPLYESLPNAVSKNLVVHFVFLWIDFTITFMLYAPKIWIILFKQKMNTHSHFTRARMRNIKAQVTIKHNRRQMKIPQPNINGISPSSSPTTGLSARSTITDTLSVKSMSP